LSNLDAKLRGQMRTEISRLQNQLDITTVYVTHDQIEAMTLGDRVAVLRKGNLQQIATPRELYEQPVNMFVAGFIGSPSMNFIPATISDGGLHTPFGHVELPESRRVDLSGKDVVLLGARPEAFEDASVVPADARQHGLTFEASIDVIEWLGSEQFAYVPYEAPADIRAQLAELERELDSESLTTQLVVSLDASSRIPERSQAELWMDLRSLHIFDPQSGDNLTLQRTPVGPVVGATGPGTTTDGGGASAATSST
ncbi:MAG: ABC transporter ATP-binding protein, partial [Jiangellaceae bacterium]